MVSHNSFRKFAEVEGSTRAAFKSPISHLESNEINLNKTKDFDSRRLRSVVYPMAECYLPCVSPKTNLTVLLLLLLLSSGLLAQDWKVDPSWLHRYVPSLTQPGLERAVDPASPACRYQPIFGEGDSENHIMLSVARFGEATIASQANCESVFFNREEEIYFVLEGNADLHYGDQTYPMRANDFTYLPPGLKHSIANASDKLLRVLIMGFRIPLSVSIGPPSSTPRIVSLDDVKEETVEGHPASVVYKLLLGPRTAKRDAIDDAYVVVSFFWMNFAPGGTNFPHHHETAEEIYLVLDGQGEMVAGGGMDGIEGRHSAKAGDAYYFRPNCTVGFYNQNNPGARAHILAVRSQVSFAKGED
jgi:mannose-6-phosphate isomerase-like protein (cupin superfamily)